jgi:hypothetical protein
MIGTGLVSRAMGALTERARAVGAAVLVLRARLGALGRAARARRLRARSLQAATDLPRRSPGPSASQRPAQALPRALGPVPEHTPAAPPAATPSLTVARAPGATSEPGLFSLVTVDAEFHPRLYAATFAALQVPRISKLLALTRARVVWPDLFQCLAAAWTAPPRTVPRLGIVLPFERWVMLRDAALASLRPLAPRGVLVEVLYQEQAAGPQIAAWFSRGLLVHKIPTADGKARCPSPTGH